MNWSRINKQKKERPIVFFQPSTAHLETHWKTNGHPQLFHAPEPNKRPTHRPIQQKSHHPVPQPRSFAQSRPSPTIRPTPVQIPISACSHSAKAKPKMPSAFAVKSPNLLVRMESRIRTGHVVQALTQLPTARQSLIDVKCSVFSAMRARSAVRLRVLMTISKWMGDAFHRDNMAISAKWMNSVRDGQSAIMVRRVSKPLFLYGYRFSAILNKPRPKNQFLATTQHSLPEILRG